MIQKRSFKSVFFGFLVGIILGALLTLLEGYTLSRLVGYSIFYGLVGIVIVLFPSLVNILH